MYGRLCLPTENTFDNNTMFRVCGSSTYYRYIVESSSCIRTAFYPIVIRLDCGANFYSVIQLERSLQLL